MRRPLLLLALISPSLISPVACTRRPAAVPDGGIAADRSHSESSLVDQRDAPPACTNLVKIGQVSLEPGDRLRTRAALSFDGERFAVLWHSQPSYISSLNGELRFALVDATGRTGTPTGILLGEDNGTLHPALIAEPGGYALVHLPTTSVLGPQLKRIEASGQLLSSFNLPQKVFQVALAPHQSGYALLQASSIGPSFHLIGRDGVISPGTIYPSAEPTSSLWLAPRPGGFVVGIHTANRNARLLLVDESGGEIGQTSVGNGALVDSPSFLVLPGGFGAVYGRSPQTVELQRFDGEGRPTGVQTVAAAGAALGEQGGQIAAVWTGSQLLVAYPGPVQGQFQLQSLDAAGNPTGGAIPLPGCLATASGITAVWGGGRLAVATIAEASGLMSSATCVTLMGCP